MATSPHPTDRCVCTHRRRDHEFLYTYCRLCPCAGFAMTSKGRKNPLATPENNLHYARTKNYTGTLHISLGEFEGALCGARAYRIDRLPESGERICVNCQRLEEGHRILDASNRSG